MTFLYAMATLWPNLKHGIPVVRRRLLATIFVSMFIQVHAQSIRERTEAGLTHVKPLQIGDTIPESLWHVPLQVVNHSNGKDTITLNDYKDKKLIIIDFWATWCTTCLSEMPRLDTLKNKVDNMIIIPVTQESLDRLESFLDRNPIAQKVNLKTVFDDKILKRYFPFRLIPHYIWIYNGRFSTASSAAEINMKTLKTLYSTGNSEATPKVDILGFDKNQSLMDNLNQRKLVVPTIYCITFSDKITGLGSSQSHTKKHGLVRRYFFNRPLIELYRFALNLETNEDKLIFDLGECSIDPKDLICYEQIYDEKMSTDPNKQMLEDLNQRFKLYVSETKTLQENMGATCKMVVIKSTK